jgi:hypothetical protein
MRKLDSLRCGGVPQQRRRVYIAACMGEGPDVEWPEPIPAPLLSTVLDRDFCPPGSAPQGKRCAEKVRVAEERLHALSLTASEMQEAVESMWISSGHLPSNLPVGIDMLAQVVVNAGSIAGSVFIGRTPCLTAARAAHGGFWLCAQRRWMTVAELLRLQAVDPGSSRIGHVLTRRQAGDLIGNSFTVSVVARVLAAVAFNENEAPRLQVKQSPTVCFCFGGKGGGGVVEWGFFSESGSGRWPRGVEGPAGQGVTDSKRRVRSGKSRVGGALHPWRSLATSG